MIRRVIILAALAAVLAASACKSSKDRGPAHQEAYPVTEMVDPVTKKTPTPRVSP